MTADAPPPVIGATTPPSYEWIQPLPPPTIGTITIELPDPRGPINDDFKRGACYLVTLDRKMGLILPGTKITISVPGGQFECKE